MTAAIAGSASDRVAVARTARVGTPIPVRPRPLAPYGFSAIRARFEHSLICDDGLLIANYARTYGASTIFVQLGGDDETSLLARNPTTVKNLQAMIAVANVYLVVGDPSWLATPTAVPPDARAAAAIAEQFPRIEGVLYDVDPTGLAAWNSSQRQALAQAFLALSGTLLAMPGAAAFKATTFTANAQLAGVHVGGVTRAPTILEALQSESGVTGLQLAVPGGSASVQLQNAAAALPQLTEPFSIVASESKYSPASYYGASPAYFGANLAAVAQSAAQQNAKFAGVTADGWNDLYNGLQSILPQPPVFNETLATGPPRVLIPPAGSTYLGAFANPLGLKNPTPGETLGLERSIGRRFAFAMHYYGWNETFPTAALRADVSKGRFPLVAWNCGDTDRNVVRGLDDANIVRHAQALKAFGSTVMIRWFWEMNLDDQNDPPRTECWDPATDLPGGYFSPEHYIAAWQHIHAIFAAQGVTNVIWLWCVSNAHGGSSQYYPGDAYVDWIGTDDYDLGDVPLADMLYIPMNELAQFQEKPAMLTETGARSAYQTTFFTGAAASLAASYPWIRALGYFDSKGAAQDWTLTGAGLHAFKAFANTPDLRARPWK